MKKRILFALLWLPIQLVLGQNALTSVNFNINNVQLSADAKTLSFDVYLRSTNKDTVVAVPGFGLRLAIPQVDLGTSEKRITITNATKELGSRGEAINASGTDWVLKFTNGILVQSYQTALVVSTEGNGTRIGTVNISNADGSAFENPLNVHLNYTGTKVRTKSTCTVFKPNTMSLAESCSAAQPFSNFSGLGSYTLAAQGSNFSVSPNPATSIVRLEIGNTTQDVVIYDMNGKKVISQVVNGSTTINISSLPSGVYTIDVNGTQKKLVKK